VITCPVCECPTQRTPDGGPLDGLRAHQEKVHPGQLTVVRVTTSHYDAQGVPLT
jgi:hypothetical protein